MCYLPNVIAVTFLFSSNLSSLGGFSVVNHHPNTYRPLLISGAPFVNPYYTVREYIHLAIRVHARGPLTVCVPLCKSHIPEWTLLQ